MSGQANDERGAERHYTCYPFHLQRGDPGETADEEIALVQDLSPAGAFLLTTHEPRIGVRVQLVLDLIDEGGVAPVVVGHVVRTEVRPDADLWGFGVAVAFDRAWPELEPAIRMLGKLLNTD